MTFDVDRALSVLVRGNIDPAMAHTWGWDGSKWIVLATGDPNRGGNALVYDSNRSVAVLFGGYDVKGRETGETWEWNGGTWQLRDVPGPAERANHAMAYDSARGVTVLFGGEFSEGGEIFYLADTWEWDGKTWTERTSNPHPSARIFHSMAYDAARRVTVLYGGAPGGNFDTWEWDGKVWTQRNTDGPSVWGRAGLVYDSDRQACILFGGANSGPDDETWQWDGQSWTQIDTGMRPPPRYDPAMAYDSARRVTVMFGGDDQNGLLDDTWEFVCTPPCAPDLDGSGTLDLFDFLAFINLFNADDPKADCDGDGAYTLFDFLCFVNGFNAGC